MTRHRQPAWSLHTQQPTHPAKLAEYGLELALRLRSDEDTCGPLEYARVVLKWPQPLWDQRIEELLDLADEIVRLEGVLGHDAEYRRCIDGYSALLTRLASGPLIEAMDEACAVGEPVRIAAVDELAVKRVAR